MKLFISPHNDDEVLFGAYTIMREKPLVIIVTHSTLQGDNGYERALESYKAMQILGVPVCFLQIPEDKINSRVLFEKFRPFYTTDLVYVPDIEKGNPHHDLINIVASEIFPNVKYYKTYGDNGKRTIGKPIHANQTEMETKYNAMQVYQTQIKNPSTSHYFESLNEYE